MARTASIGIRVEPELKEAVEKAASADERTVAQWIERLIVRELKTATPKVAATKPRAFRATLKSGY